MEETKEITRDQIAAVFPKVVQAIADALAREVEECKPTSSIIADLGAESIDLLDIVFRLERTFKIKLPRNRIVTDARGDLSEAEFERKGVLTAAGRRPLQQYLSEVPADRFPGTLHLEDVPRLFTIETFCKLVARAQRRAA